MVFRSAPQLTIQRVLMRDPVNRPFARRQRERAGSLRVPRLCKIAHQVFVEAVSGALPAGIAAVDDRDERKRVLPKSTSYSAEPVILREAPRTSC